MSSFVQGMGCCLLEPSFYLSQLWPRTMLLYGVKMGHKNKYTIAKTAHAYRYMRHRSEIQLASVYIKFQLVCTNISAWNFRWVYATHFPIKNIIYRYASNMNIVSKLKYSWAYFCYCIVAVRVAMIADVAFNIITAVVHHSHAGFCGMLSSIKYTHTSHLLEVPANVSYRMTHCPSNHVTWQLSSHKTNSQ